MKQERTALLHVKKRALEQRKALKLHSIDNSINIGKLIQSSLLESTKTIMCLRSLYIRLYMICTLGVYMFVYTWYVPERSYHSSTWKILKLLCMQWKLRYKWKFTISSSYKPIITLLGFPGGSVGEESAFKAGSMPRPGRCPGGGHSNPLQYSCLENPMDRGPRWYTVHGVTKRWTWLNQLICACIPHSYYNVCWSKSYGGTSLVVWASLIAQLVKNLHVMQEIPVWFLGREDPLEKG